MKFYVLLTECVHVLYMDYKANGGYVRKGNQFLTCIKDLGVFTAQ
jgi:hypothetical protein